MSRWTARRLAIGFTAAIVLAGCGDSGDTKAGGTEPITLELAAMEGSWAPYAGALDEFGRQVEDLSAGELRIDILWEAAQAKFGGFGPSAEQDVASLITAGDIALGLVAARTWDELEVTSLRALQAPFLIDNEELLTEVVHSDLAERMLAGLEPAGVVGLALLPENLRHPVGFDRTFLTLADFAGAQMRTPSSELSFELLQALGADPVTIAESSAVELAGAESAFAYGGDLPAFGTFTANITFYPKINTLVASTTAFSTLTGDQQEVLRQAAANTLGEIGAQPVTEAEAAASYCQVGGGVAFADPAEIAALEQAAEPVYAALERDAQTKDYIAEIRALKQETSATPAPPEPCEMRAGTPVDSPDEAEFPEGVYRTEYSAEFLAERGVTTVSDVVNTLTLQDGRWLHHVDENGVEVPDCGGTYTVESGRVSLVIAGSPPPESGCGQDGYVVFSAGWEVEGDELRFTEIRSGTGGVDPYAEVIWGSKPWTKIE